jgi:hypothetical protein
MKRILFAVLVSVVALGEATPASAQAARLDAIWARRTTAPLTLDGVLNEPAWAKAESVSVVFGKDTGVPGSGWKVESGILPSDSTRATLKLLVKDNQMYLGARVPDKSIGGSKDFNRFDGFLMAIKDHMDVNAPKPPAEYFYAWWYAEGTDPQPAGQMPAFIGRWAEWPPGSPRTPEQIANWDAVTVIDGTSNSDAVQDQGYTVEMRFNLAPMGYDVTQAAGDIVEWNLCVYDCDWFWPINIFAFSSNRVWYQSPWGNAAWYNEVRVHARPDVTVDSGPVPWIYPEYVVPEAIGFAAPTVNGTLAEPLWAEVPGFDIRYGDAALRQTYPYVGKHRSGQFQPTVNGGQAAVSDPADATVKMVVKDDKLYLGFDVRDRVVQYAANFDRWDGFLVTVNDRGTRGPDNELIGRRLSFQVAANGTALAQDYLATLVSSGKASVAIALKPGTTVDTTGLSADVGYTAELMLDLTGLGYPPGLGDRALWIGVNHLDGDSFTPWNDSYGTRTWWFRQYEGECCPAAAYLSHAPVTGLEEPETPRPPGGYVRIGAFPNPSPRQTIRYALPEPGRVTLEVFDVGGRLVERRELGLRPAGTQDAAFDGTRLSSGMYLYQLRIENPGDGALKALLHGRIVVTR